MSGHIDSLLKLMADGRVVRYRDLRNADGGPIPAMALSRLVRSGRAVQAGGGYQLAEAEFPDDVKRFVELSLRHPDGVLCLFTALRLNHHLDPSLDLSDEYSNMDTVGVRYGPAVNARTLWNAQLVTWTNAEMLTDGVAETVIGGVRIRYTTAERTVADMFRPSRGRDVSVVTPADRLRALTSLALNRGEASVQQVHAHAARLGWQEQVSQAVQVACAMLAAVPRAAGPR